MVADAAVAVAAAAIAAVAATIVGVPLAVVGVLEDVCNQEQSLDGAGRA